jgi:hypothetical protein
MRPSVLCLSFKSECAVEMSAVALVSFIEGSSVPYSVSGRNSRGDEHEVAMCHSFLHDVRNAVVDVIELRV